MPAKKQVNETVKIRRRVLTEVARLALQDKLEEEIDELPEKLLSMGNQRYRCCEYKEKAIYAERIKLALGLVPKKEYKKKRLSELLPFAFDYIDSNDRKINLIDIACEGCPINKFFITNACQNCLAHSCQNSCPRNAISIVQNQAYIDQSLCIECGICKKSCSYNAIIEINRPCEAACHLGAIKADNNRKAVIDYEKCVECGACTIGCPFGAISYSSEIIRVIDYLKNERVYVILAPAFIGQLGLKENASTTYKALKQLGFSEIFEAAAAADAVVLAEGEEFLREVPEKKQFMTTSCCPSFVTLIKKHFPELKNNISTIKSPMVVAANYLKEKDPQAKVVFIGPCLAKKTEGLKSGIVDAVITFEELATLLVAAGINASLIEDNMITEECASAAGKNFAQAGGVAAAVEILLEEENVKFDAIKAQGLKECKEVLKEIKKGIINPNFVEGMACSGGCLGGPGTLLDSRITKRFLEKYCQNSEMVSSKESLLADKIRKTLQEAMHGEEW